MYTEITPTFSYFSYALCVRFNFILYSENTHDDCLSHLLTPVSTREGPSLLEADEDLTMPSTFRFLSYTYSQFFHDYSNL